MIASSLNADFIELVSLFTLVHQALVDLFKLTGIRARRYAEALAYVVFGTSAPPPGAVGRPRRFVVFSQLPVNWPQWLFEDWQNGPQGALLQSFLLRSVGDSPVTDISDSDIDNAVRIARHVAGKELERASLLLDELVRRGVTNAGDVVTALDGLSPKDPRLAEMVGRWRGEIADKDTVSVALVADWRNELHLDLIPGVERAQVELPNTLKAAEYRYHLQLHQCSLAFAIIEGAVIGGLSGTGGGCVLNAIVAVGLLLVLPRSTKSLTDAVIGIGQRLRG